MDFWEDAIKGSSALRAGLYRRLTDECTCALGLETASIYWDVEKFYDSIGWTQLIVAAEKIEYPLELLYLGLQVHASSRVLRAVVMDFCVFFDA